MDIAALSIDMSLAKAQQSAQVSVLKKAMNAEGDAALKLLESMPPAQSFGHIMDIKI